MNEIKTNILIAILAILSLVIISYSWTSSSYNHAESMIRDFIIQSERDKKNIETYINERHKASDQKSIDMLTANISSTRASMRSQLFLLLNNPSIEKDPTLKGIILRHVVESKMLISGPYYIGSAGLRFDGADARGVNFTDAILSNLSFKETNLKGALLIKTSFKNSDLRNIVYDDTTRWRQPTFNKSTQFSEDFNPINLGFISVD